MVDGNGDEDASAGAGDVTATGSNAQGEEVLKCTEDAQANGGTAGSGSSATPDTDERVDAKTGDEGEDAGLSSSSSAKEEEAQVITGEFAFSLLIFLRLGSSFVHHL